MMKPVLPVRVIVVFVKRAMVVLKLVQLKGLSVEVKLSAVSQLIVEFVIQVKNVSVGNARLKLKAPQSYVETVIWILMKNATMEIPLMAMDVPVAV